MKPLKQTVLDSLDGTDEAILPYIPYLLQDFREIGSDPETMLLMIEQHIPKKHFRILDLGCGKGAVACRLAQALSAYVHGIDAMDDFIISAKQYAHQLGLDHKVTFEVADVRLRIQELKNYDLVVLGSIGAVFGDMYQTLKTLEGAINDSGYVLVDDAFLPDHSTVEYNRCLSETEFYTQIAQAGFSIVAEQLFDRSRVYSGDEDLLKGIEQRISELIESEPSKKEVFKAYLKSQQHETWMLDNALVTGTWLLHRK